MVIVDSILCDAFGTWPRWRLLNNWPSGQVDKCPRNLSAIKQSKIKVDNTIPCFGEEKREKETLVLVLYVFWWLPLQPKDREEKVRKLRKRKRGSSFSAESKESCKEPKRKKKLLLHLVSNHPPK